MGSINSLNSGSHALLQELRRNRSLPRTHEVRMERIWILRFLIRSYLIKLLKESSKSLSCFVFEVFFYIAQTNSYQGNKNSYNIGIFLRNKECADFWMFQALSIVNLSLEVAKLEANNKR